jgi:putative glutathione S-transferase
MGKLVGGVWHTDEPISPTDGSGAFQRKDSVFRDWIEDRAGARFKPEAGRYHLYVAYACPWAHRALILRRLKGLGNMISVSVVIPLMLENGWSFSVEQPDHLFGVDHIHQIYQKADPAYTGKATVPVLWDKTEGTIVSNESAEIVRMFNSAFDQLGAAPGDYYPADLRDEIDAVNNRIYETVNNGVYRCGFARTQEAYDTAFDSLFATFDWVEDRLSRSRYLIGDRLTEADWRLFPTLFRFDPVYHGHFKCNRNRLIEFPNLWAYSRELYQWPGIAETVDLLQTKQHYYGSHASLNATGIVPKGPEIDYLAPHDRDRLPAAA